MSDSEFLDVVPRVLYYTHPDFPSCKQGPHDFRSRSMLGFVGSLGMWDGSRMGPYE